MDTSELQRQLDREAVARYEAAHGKTIKQMDAELAGKLASRRTQVAATSSPALTTMQKIVDDFQRKYPNGTPKVTTREPGSLQREAEKMAEAMGRARRGDIGEASAPSGADRLPRYTVPG
jgi:hypothetical protein